MRRLALGLLTTTAFTGPVLAAPVQTVFVIAMENHNLTQPGSVTSPQQLMGNPAAPYLNSLMTPGNPNAAMTSYATNLTNAAPGVHPSEPNYIWENSGSSGNPGVLTDADPSAANNNIVTSTSMTGLMTQKGVTWKSYQEDTQVNLNNNTVLPQSQWTVPSTSASGSNAGYVNPYNGSNQYNYAAKHNPMVFFSDSNQTVANYAPLQQLATDLTNNTVAQYNWITPDQFNDMHSSLNTNFTYNGVTYNHNTDQEAVALGDNFLSIVVPEIEASQAFQNNGVIEIWFDESEGGDTSAYTIPEIIISPDAKGNAFDVTEPLTHSADLLTEEEIFQLGQCLGASCGSPDLAAFFQAGSIPNSVPEPTSLLLLSVGLLGTGLLRRRRG
jgi:phosphatidylinositol-3-phosphatase